MGCVGGSEAPEKLKWASNIQVNGDNGSLFFLVEGRVSLCGCPPPKKKTAKQRSASPFWATLYGGHPADIPPCL